MTRKDYFLIAKVIRDSNLVREQRDALVEEFSKVLLDDNPNFNAAKFALAAGYLNWSKDEQ